MTSIREILGLKRSGGMTPAKRHIFDDELDEKSNMSGMTVINVDDLKTEMKPFRELLEEYKEMRLRFNGIVALPPKPAELKGRPSSFKETLAYTTVQSNYAKIWKAMKAAEEKNNSTKIKLFSFLQAAKDLSEGRDEENFTEEDVTEFYRVAGEEANTVIATWTLHAKAEKMTIEEYVNRYIKF